MESRIPDESGKHFDSLDRAYEHGRKLIDNILRHVGNDDANDWKLIVSNNEDDVQLIIPFAISYFSAQRELRTELSLKTSSQMSRILSREGDKP